MENAPEHNETLYEGAIEGIPIPKITWEAPRLVENELGEITRAAQHFANGPQEQADIALRIYDALSQGNLEDLQDDIWEHLENTDSYDIVPGDFAKVREMCLQNNRNFDVHVKRLVSGQPIPSPTIAVYNNVPHKVGGNTRLMFARALGIRPKVIVARIEKRETPTELQDISMESLENVIEFFSYAQSSYPNRESFEKMVTELPPEYRMERRALAIKLAEVYYELEKSPTLEEFVKKVHKLGVI